MSWAQGMDDPQEVYHLRGTPKLPPGEGPETRGEEDYDNVKGDDHGGGGAPTAKNDKACTHEEGLLRDFLVASLPLGTFVSVNRLDDATIESEAWDFQKYELWVGQPLFSAPTHLEDFVV